MLMEKEIVVLKDKLIEVEDKIKELEVLKVKELNYYLEVEKFCRIDLEMYVVVLNIQKFVLQEDVEKLWKELYEVVIFWSKSDNNIIS